MEPPVEEQTGAQDQRSPFWRALSVIARSDHGAVYDPVRGRMIVIMGAAQGAASYGYLSDAQALSLRGDGKWRPLATIEYHRYEAPEQGRARAAAVYDAANDRVLVHGGYSETTGDFHQCCVCWAHNDLWELRLSPSPHWAQLGPTGEAPRARFGHAAIYDPVRQRMLIFGGRTDPDPTAYCWRNRALGDLWALELHGTLAWRPIAQSGDVPAPGLAGTALYDSARDRMLYVVSDTVWAMTLDPPGTWARLATVGPGPTGGPAVLDPSRDRVLVQAGSHTWELPLSGASVWHEIQPAGLVPAPTVGHTVMWDPEGDQLVLFGGTISPEPSTGATWFLSFRDNPRWTRRPDTDRPELVGHDCIYDPLRDRMIAVGGLWTEPTVFAFSLEQPDGWSPLPVAGEPPAASFPWMSTCDPRRDRILVYWATESSRGIRQISLADPPQWSPLPVACPSGMPNWLGSLVLDPVRDRLLLFGGVDPLAVPRDETWELDLEGGRTWRLVPVEGPRPAPRFWHNAVYDPVRDRMVIHGGFNDDGFRGDWWSLSLGSPPRWTLLTDNWSCCGFGAGLSLVYDPVRDRALSYGSGGVGNTCIWPVGYDACTTIERYGAGWDEFMPPARWNHAAIYDPVRDRMVVSGGSAGPWYSEPRRDVWALTWGTPVRDVIVDIRPGSNDDTVNPCSNGVLPVAILSEARFDATAVDPLSVRLAGAGVRLRGNGQPQALAQDVNGDGRADLVLHVEMSHMILAAADTVAQLTGSAPGNTTIRGHDAVRVVGCGVPSKPAAQPLPAVQAAGPELVAARALGSGRIALSFALVPGREATLELYDVTGRRIAARAVAGGASGLRQEELDAGPGCASGLYWVRLRQAGQMVARRVLVLR